MFGTMTCLLLFIYILKKINASILSKYNKKKTKQQQRNGAPKYYNCLSYYTLSTLEREDEQIFSVP